MVAILSEVVHIQLVEDHITRSTHFYLKIERDVHESEVAIKLFEITILTKRCPQECAHPNLVD